MERAFNYPGKCLWFSEHSWSQQVPSVSGVITAPSLLPVQQMLDLLWRAGNILCFDRLHTAPRETGSCRSSCACAWILFECLFLSKTESHRCCQTSYFSRKDSSSPTEGDFIALECRQGHLWLCGFRMQSFLSLSPLRSRPAIQYGLINLLWNAEFPPTMLLLILQSYVV